MSLVYLILGGNQGNRTEIFCKAIDLVSSDIGQIVAKSALYESESWGFQSDLFINQAVIVNTNLRPALVLAQTQHIETSLGRSRKSAGYESRTMDIDLLYYDEMVVQEQGLTIPHPRIAERMFVLVPMAEIAPHFKDPITGDTISEMLRNCLDLSKVWLLGSQ